MAAKVLLVDSGPLSQAVVKEALEKAGYEVSTAGTGAAALQQVAIAQPQVVVLDLTLPDADGVAVCRRIKENEEAPVVLTTSRLRPGGDDRLLSFGAGADDYLAKPYDPRDLVARVGALLAGQQEPSGRRRAPARVFSFYSAKGGAGTTSICVNAAAALAAAAKGEGGVVVADLVLPIGSVGLTLGLEEERSLVSLAALDPAQITPQAVEECLLSRPRLGFRTLLGSPDPARARLVSPNTVEAAFNSLRRLTDYALVDVGGALSRISMPVLQMSDRIVIVLAFSRAALHLTKVSIDFLIGEGIAPQKLLLVLNRPGVSVSEDLNRSDIEDYLDRPLAFAVPYEGNRFTEAANEGLPLVIKDREATASMVIEELASRLLSVGGAPRG